MPAAGLTQSLIDRRRRHGGSATSNAALAPPTGQARSPRGSTPAPGTASIYPTSSGGGYHAPSTVPASHAVSRSRTTARSILTSSAGGHGRGAILSRVLNGISDPAARQLAPFAIQASREVNGAVPASVLLALTGQESDYGRNQGPSSAGAQGVSQFIPGTRATMISKYGIDPWKSPKDGIRAAAYYLRDLGFKKDPQGALSGYSGGYAASDYNNPILSNARNFRSLDKLAGSHVKVKGGTGPRPLSISELGYTPGINIDEGQKASPFPDHYDHVHFASTRPRDILRAALIAKRKGGFATANPAFTSDHAPITSGHTSDSFHYRNMDFSRKLQNSKLARKAGAGGPIIGEAIDIDAPGNDSSILSAIDRALARRNSGAPVTGAASTVSSGGGGVIGSALAGSPAGGGFSNPIAGAQATGRTRQVGGSLFSPAKQTNSAFPNLTPDPTRSPQDLLDALAAYAQGIRPRRRRTVTR